MLQKAYFYSVFLNIFFRCYYNFFSFYVKMLIEINKKKEREKLANNRIFKKKSNIDSVRFQLNWSRDGNVADIWDDFFTKTLFYPFSSLFFILCLLLFFLFYFFADCKIFVFHVLCSSSACFSFFLFNVLYGQSNYSQQIAKVS